jgi:isoaspartyl peptidase/L-asparaginase-like protein (Ntn-hydrolase superfamily)
MKVVISKLACDFVSAGQSMQVACETAIKVMEERVQGYGGLIGIDHLGRPGIAYNTKAMPHAYAIADHQIIAGR